MTGFVSQSHIILKGELDNLLKILDAVCKVEDSKVKVKITPRFKVEYADGVSKSKWIVQKTCCKLRED